MAVGGLAQTPSWMNCSDFVSLSDVSRTCPSPGNSAAVLFWGELPQQKNEPRQLGRDHAAVSTQGDKLQNLTKPGFERVPSLPGVSGCRLAM